MKTFMAALMMVMVFAGAAFASEVYEAFIKKGCENWYDARLQDTTFAEFDKALSPAAAAHGKQVFAEGAAKAFEAYFGPLEGSFSDVKLGIGVKKGFTYKSLTMTYELAMAEMTVEDMRGLLTILASNAYLAPNHPWPNNPDYKTVATLFAAEAVNGPLIVHQFLKTGDMFTKELAFAPSESYKKLWVALANSDSRGFVETVRKYSDVTVIKAVPEFCKIHEAMRNTFGKGFYTVPAK